MNDNGSNTPYLEHLLYIIFYDLSIIVNHKNINCKIHTNYTEQFLSIVRTQKRPQCVWCRIVFNLRFSAANQRFAAHFLIDVCIINAICAPAAKRERINQNEIQSTALIIELCCLKFAVMQMNGFI